MSITELGTKRKADDHLEHGSKRMKKIDMEGVDPVSAPVQPLWFCYVTYHKHSCQ